MILDLSFFSLGSLQIVAFGFGIIIGSFLNVYIYRFHTGKSLTGHSHCLSCGTTLRWYELFPLLSYAVLRGRCRTCGCRITPRYFLVELVTGLLFALSLTVSLDMGMIVLLWMITAVLVVITVYDLYHFIIPDRLTAILLGTVAAFLGYQYWLGIINLTELGGGVVAAVGGAFFFYLLWFVSKGKWIGFGDVKLAVPLGLLVGPAYVFSFVVFSFWIGALISVAILGYGRWSRGKAHLHLPGKALTMKSAVPFAPFLVASSLIILFTHFDVFEIFSFTQFIYP